MGKRVPTIKLSKEIMLDILDSGEVLEEQIIDHGRWTIQYEIIFKYEDKYYRAYYSIGATEMQCESPWEYDDEVNCYEVHKVSKMVEVWEDVN